MKKKNPSSIDFEKSIDRLEKIVEDLEQGNIPLEDSIALYEEGIKLSKLCIETLQKAELRVKQLTKTIDGTIEMNEFE